MLSDFEQDLVWQGMLGAEIRAAYFAALVQRYQNLQKFLVVGSLLLSSGATLTLLISVVPPNLNWIKPLLTVLAAALSLWSLVVKNERNAINSADLHMWWSILAIGYQELWANIYVEGIQEKLAALRNKEAEVSKSSTALPSRKRLLARVQDNVVMHHTSAA